RDWSSDVCSSDLYLLRIFLKSSKPFCHDCLISSSDKPCSICCCNLSVPANFTKKLLKNFSLCSLFLYAFNNHCKDNPSINLWFDKSSPKHFAPLCIGDFAPSLGFGVNAKSIFFKKGEP